MCPFSSRTLNVRSGHIARDRCKVCRRSLPSPGADPGTQDFSPSPVPQPRRPPLPAGLFIGRRPGPGTRDRGPRKGKSRSPPARRLRVSCRSASAATGGFRRRETPGAAYASPSFPRCHSPATLMEGRAVSNLFELSAPWWELVLRGTVVYFALLVLVRLSGKRTVGEFTPFDLIVVVLLCEAVSGSLSGEDS